MVDAGYAVVAERLLEAAASMAHSEVRDRLSQAVHDAHKDPAQPGAYYVDHTGDGTSGDCIYNRGGDLRSAPYATDTVGGKSVTHLDTANAKAVHPHVEYVPLADDDDHYSSMESQQLYAEMDVHGLPMYERFISKSERKSADEGSFAGKGRSYPILKPEDVGAAVHAMGRAGAGNYGAGALKANIIRIAKKKGWGGHLPKEWDSGEKESTLSPGPGDLRLVESAACLDTIVVKEARADYEIKLIAPGKGASAFYPAEVLKRDGPKVFKEGTHVYLNHATASEEAERPEGDVRNLAGVLTQPAHWSESHSKGPGLYSRMKVFTDHAQTVEEKAPHVGMSIRASGIREAGKVVEGLPVLKELTHAESVDVVTRPGAGGMILVEAARAAERQEVDVDNAAIQKLEEKQRTMARGFARISAERAGFQQLAGLRLPESMKQGILTRCIEVAPITADGEFDAAAFKTLIEREIAYAGELIGAPATVVGMGSPAELTEARRAEKGKEDKQRVKESARLFGLRGKTARRIFAEGRGAFDPNYNSADKGDLDTLEA